MREKERKGKKRREGNKREKAQETKHTLINNTKNQRTKCNFCGRYLNYINVSILGKGF